MSMFDDHQSTSINDSVVLKRFLTVQTVSGTKARGVTKEVVLLLLEHGADAEAQIIYGSTRIGKSLSEGKYRHAP